MSDAPRPPTRPPRKPFVLLAPRVLVTVAVVVLFLGVMAGLVGYFVRDSQMGSADLAAAALANLTTWIAVALALSSMLVGLAVSVRFLRDIRAAVIRLERFQYEMRPASADTTSRDPPSQDGELAAGPVPSPVTQEMLLVLRDLRDNSLLSDEERRDKKLRVTADEIRNTQTLLRGLIEQDNFVQAREMADRLAHKYAAEPDAAALVQEVERAREKRQSADVKNIVKQVGDLMSISAWDRARAVAAQLVERHPDSTEAEQLTGRIEREFQVFQAEQRRRMYAEIQRYVSRRRWAEALSAAKTFIERFPQSEESESLGVQLATLENNAEVETRQELEAEITDLARHGRYIEAAELARKVIDRFPGSPQADVLRSQLGRLEELAHNPDAPPARVRVD